ncbi:prosaposin [Caerostris extrusa]|uniref:Prosaposin n=1 Tax=Caerostris extrusa TaxID=172846 RepID=A0AAV4VDT4_CAEEX|nr:prosaposin [Caerostris extrusa]
MLPPIKRIGHQGMCTLMGLCSNQACTKTPLIKVVPAREAHRKIPLMKLRPAHRLPNLESFPLVRLVPAEFTSKKQMKNTNDIAPICIIFFELLEKLKSLTPLLKDWVYPFKCSRKIPIVPSARPSLSILKKKSMERTAKDGVRNAFGNVCEKWMIEYPEHCHRIINMYSLKMQMAIAKGISFDDLCAEVKVCALEEDKSGELNVKVIPKIGESPFCDLCKEAFNEVEKTLKDPAIKQKLKDSLDQVCNMLPKSFQDDCKNFVNQNVDALIDILEQELAPDSICPALKLCGSKKITKVPKRVKDLECDVCKDVVSSLRTKLQDPASKEEIYCIIF